ncbi:PAS domain S-box protein [Oceanispirochaeta sp.]|jgi:two-component system cell cycle sensor histidine kinase/response regulator CckA|uniref:PAS domain S-box protein n=1 Tax=Oceanispirochaeta sp. TaxID=2035350 RepID=UPI00262D2287|nr:PAS domain S-box protein [Oceanispirochaeta sp.]MDA3956677.1 PAS domain S-box protein [Oceanispirochaeta sp.]
MSVKLSYEELEQRIKALEKAESERKKTKYALKESEDKFKLVFESANVGKSITSPNGRVSVNQAFADMLGYTREELRDKTWQELTPPEDIEVINQKLNSILAEEQKATRFEKKYIHKNGSIIWADVSTVLHRDPEGKPLHFITTVVDISEKKIAEEALIENEKRYRKAQTLGKVGNWEFNLENGHFWGSEEAKRIYGFEHDGPEFTTEEVESCIPKREWVHQVLMDLIEEGKEYNIEFDIITRNTGARRTIHSIAELEKNDKGKPVKVTGVIIDITERKYNIEELKRRNYFIESIMNNMPIGLALNTIDDGDVMYMNSMFEDIYGWSRDVFTNTSLFFDKVFPDPEYHQKMKSQIIADMQSGDPNRMVWNDIKIMTASGEERYVTAINIPLIEQNLMISTVQNTTARKRAEKEHDKLQNQLQQSQKMESVGRLAGGVAHDFNNILSIIIGYSELALIKTDNSGPLHDNIVEILSAAKRSTDITQQLLAFARKQTIAPKVIDLNHSIGDMIEMVQRMIGEDIDLNWLPGGGVWPIKMDSSQILQLLANLCINSRDAITNVGKIIIETKNTVFDDDYCSEHAGFIPGEYVLLTVSDDGQGMTAETRDKIFEPFFTTKSMGHGTGLGMATVYGIVKQNKGFINVYSEIEKGTTIRVYLPRYIGLIVQAQKQKILEIPKSRDEMVLLVEDDDLILELGKMILENLGYAVLSTNNPMEAGSLAAENAGKLKLLITDVIMPNMNGRELSEELQSLYPDLKTLFMSGYTADIIADRGVLEEGFNFIGKPFSMTDLAVKVREVLDQDND